MAVDAVTALQGLDDTLGLTPQESVMIFGEGGVGHLAVQLAKRMGARVFAVASGDDGVAWSRAWREVVVDGHKDDVLWPRSVAQGLDARAVRRGRRGGGKSLAGPAQGGRMWPIPMASSPSRAA